MDVTVLDGFAHEFFHTQNIARDDYVATSPVPENKDVLAVVYQH